MEYLFKVHNVSQWRNLRQLAEPLGGAVGLLEAVSFKEVTESVCRGITGRGGNKKSELMLIRHARVYSSFSSQVILVYLHPFCCNSLFCSQKSPKNH